MSAATPLQPESPHKGIYAELLQLTLTACGLARSSAAAAADALAVRIG